MINKIHNKISTSPLGSLLWSIFSLLVFFELTALQFAFLGAMGMILWLIALLFFIGVSLYSAGLFLKSFSVDKLFILCVWLVIISLIVFNVSKLENISFETTQQAACAIRLWRNAPDRGFHQSCFLGYPSRQYLLLALPSLVFDQSLTALNIGGSLYFMFSMLLWSVGLYHFLKKQGAGAGFLTALSVAVLPHFHFVNHFLFYYYEQSQFPLSISMAFWGVFLWMVADKQKWQAPFLGLLLLFMSQMYTPAIAFFSLAVCMIIYLFHKKMIRAQELIVLGAGSCLSLCLTFLHRSDVRLTGDNNSNIPFLTKQFLFVIQHFFWKSSENIQFSSALGKLVMALAFSSVVFLKSKKVVLLATWSFVTLFIATVSQGYFYYGADFRVHRSLVALPTIILLAVFLVQKITYFVHKNVPKIASYEAIVQAPILLLVIVSGFFYMERYLSTRVVCPHMYLTNALRRLGASVKQKDTIVFSEEASRQFLAHNDFLMYFYPHLTMQVVRLEEMKRNCDKKSIFVVDATEEAFFSSALTNCYTNIDFNQTSFHFGEKPHHRFFVGEQSFRIYY